MPYPRAGGGGGSGFSLGPANNLFGATAGDASSNPLLITPAAGRAAAEAIRDNYFAANPANLAIYDEAQNASLGVLLYFLGGSVNTVQQQTRVGGEWRDSSAIIAIQGSPGRDFESNLNAIGIASSDSPYQASLYDSITASLNGNDVTINFPPGTPNEEEIVIASVLLIESNKLILTGDFSVATIDGEILTDSELHITENKKYNFKWFGATWRIQL
ncbi:hypothetical protein NVP1076O_32 [Vibrio phage 1.076.O._10N.286.51.B7]|nr:hypothetical protein NVP1076O_32 [Vibrio phage 1.076.O._10N.286.51.B7]